VRQDLAREGGWKRLHPLSPLTRIGRLVPFIVLSFLLTLVQHNGQQGPLYYPIGITVASVVFGFVHWLVTRWKIEGDTLRIETGLVRRDSKRLPLARIQAVDVVRPLLARVLGVSELRIRLAGSGGSDGRLAYLSEATALEVRERLLLKHVPAVAAGAGTTTSDVSMSGARALAGTGMDADASARSGPPIPEHTMALVPTGRLIGSVALSGLTLFLLAIAVALLVLAFVAPKTAVAVGGFLAAYLFSFVTGLWRRLSNEFHFEAVEAPEGVRVRRGLLQTVSETIPHGRIQAVRKIEPLLWRPMGWCRLEVDIAGAGRKTQRGEGSGVARKALLPVGNEQDAWHLVDRLIGGTLPTMTPPPVRARKKAPLSYHFLSAGHDKDHAVCVTGRLRRVTTWVPLEKSQSIRRVQGPVQRRLGLATVHVDAAGKATRAEFRDRTVAEADQLIEVLSDLSREARLHRAAPPVERASNVGAAIPAGWYPDPSGRHEERYWRDGAWTEHVSDRGATAIDAV
jgi:putative membrane protein